MIARLRRSFIVLLIIILFCTATRSADAGIAGASDGKTAGVIIALVAVGALIGIGIYYTVHHGHSLRGCASSGPSGVQILNERDQTAYKLSGTIDGIKTGDRVRVSGNKKKADKTFVVTRVAKDYGVCRIQPATT